MTDHRRPRPPAPGLPPRATERPFPEDEGERILTELRRVELRVIGRIEDVESRVGAVERAAQETASLRSDVRELAGEVRSSLKRDVHHEERLGALEKLAAAEGKQAGQRAGVRSGAIGSVIASVIVYVIQHLTAAPPAAPRNPQPAPLSTTPLP